jgi:hypothetical protein
MTTRKHIAERMEGEDLYQWGRLMAEIDTVRRQIDQFGQRWLMAHGYRLETATLTNEGYILVEVPSDNGFDPTAISLNGSGEKTAETGPVEP